VAKNWLDDLLLTQVTKFGLSEVDDRYHVWRVPLKNASGKSNLGEVVIDAYTGEVQSKKTTRPALIEARLLKKDEDALARKKNKKYEISSLRNIVGLGDCIELAEEMPAKSVDLICKTWWVDTLYLLTQDQAGPLSLIGRNF